MFVKLAKLMLQYNRKIEIRRTIKHSATNLEIILPKRLQKLQHNDWNDYDNLSAEHNPVNLAKEIPDDFAPEYAKDILANVAKSDEFIIHQYAHPYGQPNLRTAFGNLYSNYISQDIDPATEVLVTNGALQGIFCSIFGHVEKGDEVIVMEPYITSYRDIITMSNGRPRFIPLELHKDNDVVTSSDWKLNFEELEKLFNKKTKMIVLNNPHNPTGKVFSYDEMEIIAKLCQKWNVLCISDETYEWMVFDGNEHIRMCTLPNMWDRTITICSASNTFSLSGWRVGFCYGPSHLLKNLKLLHMFALDSCAKPIQEALACCINYESERLETSLGLLNNRVKELQSKRDFLLDAFRKSGMKPTIPQAGFFILGDWSNLKSKINLTGEKDKYSDMKFTKWMIKTMGLQAMPISAFFSNQHKYMGENFARFSFGTKQETLDKASKILSNFQNKLGEDK